MVEVADLLGIKFNRLAMWCHRLEIDPTMWWYHTNIVCENCRHQIDPDRKLSKEKRIKLHADPKCDVCRPIIAKQIRLAYWKNRYHSNKDYVRFEEQERKRRKKELLAQQSRTVKQ